MNDLGQPMNEAFRQLYASFPTSNALNFEEVKKAAISFFDSNHIKNTDAPSEKVRKATLHDKFFQNFTKIWLWLLNQRQLGDAEYFWELAVKPALAWESQNLGCRIHKGTAYYFWGGTAVLNGNLDKGYLLMHEALEEDIKTHGKQLPDTPSLIFAALDYRGTLQTFRDWLLAQFKFLEELLKEYRSSYSKLLTAEELQKRFLKNPSVTPLVFLFAYTLARFFNLEKTSSYAQSSDFANQLGINLLFDLALVVEVTIKVKSEREMGALRDQINNYLLVEPRINQEFIGWNGNTTQKLGKNGRSRTKEIFEQTLKDLLSPDPFRFDDGSELTTVTGKDLALTYMIRNYGAHNVSPVQTVWERFTELRQSLFNVLFLCVETLYP